MLGLEDLTHKYILIGNKIYVNIDQSVIELYVNLYIRAKPFFFLERRTRIPIINLLPNFIIRAIRVFQFTYAFYRKKKIYRVKKTIPTETVKYYGQFLLRLRQGEYKILNLKEQKVITIFPKELLPTEIEERIKTAGKAAKCKMAPRLIQWNVNERYLIENYINSKRPSYNFNKIENHYLEIFSILENIMTTTHPRNQNLQKYILNMTIYLDQYLEKSQFNKCDTIENVSIIKNFCTYLTKRIQEFNQEEIIMVFSHGDFWEGNILIRNKCSSVIDWNTLDTRSFYFDFYYIMFMLSAKGNHLDKVDYKGLIKLTNSLEKGFKLFKERIIENPNISSLDYVESIGNSHIYRYIFYLELIYLKLQKTEEAFDKQIREALTWIRRFKIYEENFMGNCNFNIIQTPDSKAMDNEFHIQTHS